MGVEDGFDQLQGIVDVPPDVMREARRRRGFFKSSLEKADDVLELFASGSLARGTHKDPLHDVDVVCVFDPDKHEDWGSAGGSADTSLDRTSELINAALGTGGSDGEEVRLTRKQNHAVKCFLDDPEDEDPFTVDVTPALRHSDGGILIPERESSCWIRSDPEYLMALVDERHSGWRQFAKLVRVLKRWNTDNGALMKSLVIEVLALDHLPEADRPDALARFFTAASVAIMSPVVDPAGLCGEIQSDLDRATARELFSKASDKAWRAVDAAKREEEDWAMCIWREVFGDIFPEPPGGCAKAKGAIALITTTGRPKRPVVDAPQG